MHCTLAQHLPLASQFTGSHRAGAPEGPVDAFPSSTVQTHLYRQPQLGELEKKQPEKHVEQLLRGRLPRQAGSLSGYSNCAGTLHPSHSPRTREVIVKLFGMLMGATMLLAQEVYLALQTSLGLVSLRYGCKLFKIHGTFAQVHAHNLFLCPCLCVVLWCSLPLTLSRKAV